MSMTKVYSLTSKTMAWSSYWASHLTLWRDPMGSVSLYVTTLFWGAGAVLQFVVLLWAQREMGLSLQQGAYLQALVAIGVVCGAFLAAKCFKIYAARKVLPWGFLLAFLMPVMAYTHSLWLAVPLLILAGMIAGLMLVPMNALLQQRGAKLLSAGRSIAVQGFNENLSVLIMLGAYSALLALEATLPLIMLTLGLLLFSGLLLLFYRMKRRH
jgi:predicted MFS family arabinose efflux permease